MHDFIKREYRGANGFTLVEVLISMTLGLFLLAMLVSVFSANIKSYELSRGVSYMQSNARFAIDKLQRSLRMAGYQGCSNQATAPVEILSTNAPTDSYRSTRLFVATVGPSNWLPSFPHAYTPSTGVGAPVPGSEAILIQYASSERGALTSDMATTTSPIVISDSNQLELEDTDLALISNCSSATLFTVDSVTNSSDTTSIRSVERLPFVFTVRAQVDESAPASGTVETTVHRFHSEIYFVGDTGRTNRSGDATRALYVQTWPYDNSNPPVELVEGVDQMQITVSMTGMNSSQFLSPDDAGFDSRESQSVRFGILMASIERYGESDLDKTFRVGGIDMRAEGSVGADPDAPSYLSDGRIRRAYSTVVKIRNNFNDR